MNDKPNNTDPAPTSNGDTKTTPNPNCCTVPPPSDPPTT
jgi:hypothetical protein